MERGQLSSSNLYVGYFGNGTFTQSVGTNAVSQSLILGFDSGASGVYNLNGGLLLTGSLAKGYGTAAFKLGGGTLQAAGNFMTTMPITVGSGNSTIDTNGFNVTLSGNLSASGSLTKEGLGMLALEGGLSMTDSCSLLVNSGSMTALSHRR